MQGRAFQIELLRLRAEFDALQEEHSLRRLRTPAEERDHLDRFNRWIVDVEAFRLTYLATLNMPVWRIRSSPFG
jgi:hypothetical protein